MQSFREALQVLQRQVEDLDELKATHYQEIVEHEEEVWDVVQGKVCLVVRSTLDVFDRFTSKAYVPEPNLCSLDIDFHYHSSDPVIEPMLQSVPDPFDSYGPPPAEDKIFSILPPLSVMASAPSSSPSPLTSSTPDLASSDSSDGMVSANSSWAPSSGAYFAESNAAWATSVGSPPSQIASSSSSPRPTSPTPIARSASPPSLTSISPRRNSHPPMHQSRKSESKLRSVLSVIDETASRHNDDLHEGTSRSVSEPALASSYEVPENPAENGWGTIKVKKYPGPTPISTSETDLTPRNVSSLGSQSPSNAETPHATRSLSPHSDDTIVPPS